MKEPSLVADCVSAMRKAVAIPVTVKCRIGVDDQNPEVALRALIRECTDAGITSFTVHARKAWLQACRPRKTVMCRRWDYAAGAPGEAGKSRAGNYPQWWHRHMEDAETHLARFDGVMLGRAAYQNAAMLAEVDSALFRRRGG